jgi:hypothetical protein
MKQINERLGNGWFRSALLAIALVCAGCSTGRPMARWQSTLEQYVTDTGNGDLNVLRQVQPGSPLIKFGITDDDLDVKGVLLGVRAVASRTWYIYLAGVTKDYDVQDIRLMAVTREDQPRENSRDDYDWSVAAQDKVATNRYRSSRIDAWRKNQAQVRDDKQFKMIFPARDDLFTLNVQGTMAIATDPLSGATWRMVIGENADQTLAKQPSKK